MTLAYWRQNTLKPEIRFGGISPLSADMLCLRVVMVGAYIPVVIVIELQYHIILQIHVYGGEHAVPEIAGLLWPVINIKIPHLVFAGKPGMFIGVLISK